MLTFICHTLIPYFFIVSYLPPQISPRIIFKNLQFSVYSCALAHVISYYFYFLDPLNFISSQLYSNAKVLAIMIVSAIFFHNMQVLAITPLIIAFYHHLHTPLTRLIRMQFIQCLQYSLIHS